MRVDGGKIETHLKKILAEMRETGESGEPERGGRGARDHDFPRLLLLVCLDCSFLDYSMEMWEGPLYWQWDGDGVGALPKSPTVSVG